ncbi:Hypothetical predicted protein [Marmota monax]|uniref:Uncharacterized protein n=1 Tax=Marmota monax TaxID=9995 RepID=A0A5E4ALX9_MARMO|nr:hypothetical protein GHT09_015928 [Marmota monax]VTJ58334.1 Hypothetical predicted protein [Marmota monax]
MERWEPSFLLPPLPTCPHLAWDAPVSRFNLEGPLLSLSQVPLLCTRTLVQGAGEPRSAEGGPALTLRPSFCLPPTPAWDDGKIRAFAPETGRLIYVINSAHRIGVTAIATTSDCKRVISGGGEGEVRVWQIGCQTQKLEESLKEHKSSVSCIRVKKNNEECVTASTDGTCIIWDLV